MEMANNVTIDGFYEVIKETYKGNNHISTVKVEFFDGKEYVQMVYKTPEGFQQDQMQRRGKVKLELK